MQSLYFLYLALPDIQSKILRTPLPSLWWALPTPKLCIWFVDRKHDQPMLTLIFCNQYFALLKNLLSCCWISVLEKNSAVVMQFVESVFLSFNVGKVMLTVNFNQQCPSHSAYTFQHRTSTWTIVISLLPLQMPASIPNNPTPCAT